MYSTLRRVATSIVKTPRITPLTVTARCQSGAPDITLETNTQRVRRPSPQEMDSLLDIGSRQIFNEDHDIFRESVRRFFREQIAPQHEKWERQGQLDREAWLEAGKQGLLGIMIPQEAGGAGGTVLDAAVVWDEQAYINDFYCGFPMHSDIVMPYIHDYGTKEQIDRLIPAMARGEKIGALAMSEPGAGSDVQGIKTYAKRDGDDWILNGSKVFITNGWMADVTIVVAVTDPKAKNVAHGASLFIVEEGMKGYIKGRKLEKIGMKASDTAELFFDDLRVPSSAMLGEENKGFMYLMTQLPQERLIIGSMSLSHTEWMFEITRQYVKERKAFGKTLSALQTIQHKLAEMKTDICIGRSFTDDALDRHNIGKLDSEGASMVKYWMSDLENKVAYDCLQMHGGWGFMWEYPIAKAYVNARVQPIYAGSNEIMKELIARAIVKKS